MKRGAQGQRWQKPQPAQQVAPGGARLREGAALPVGDADVPGFHGQRLPLGPEPAKVDAAHQKEKRLHGVSVLKRVAHLGGNAENQARHDDDAKHQHALVQPAGHAAAQWGGRHEKTNGAGEAKKPGGATGARRRR